MSKNRVVKHLASVFFALCCPFLFSAEAVAYDVDCMRGFLADPSLGYSGGYKATGTGGVDYSNIKTQWLGNGKYKVSMTITPLKNVKRWYVSFDRYNWSAYDYVGAFPDGTIAKNCVSGTIVIVQEKNTVLVGGGTGTVTITPGSMGRKLIPDGSLAIYDQSKGNLFPMGLIKITKSSAQALTAEDTTPKQIDFTIEVSKLTNVGDGTYDLRLIIPLGSTTTWFPIDANFINWWQAPNNIPITAELSIPLVVRADGNKPADPTISCNIASSLEFDHGTVKPEDVKSSIIRKALPISCNSSGTGSIEITSDDNGSSSYANVSMKNGVYSHLSVSSDSMSFSRKLPSFPLAKGTTNLIFESALVADGNVQPGSLSGSAVAIIKYN